jgi:hypothetical protein
MLVKAQATVRGAKMFKGRMDSGKLFVEVILKESDNAFGMCTEPMKCKNSAVVESVKHLTFPFIAELEIEMVSGSKGMEQNVLTVVPMQAIKSSQPLVSKA